MLYRWLADLVLLVHLGFVIFVAFGGVLVWRWPRLAWLHLPAVLWGAYVEFSGRLCPLTPLENLLRQAAGQKGYQESFLEHYIFFVLYPEGLTREVQLWLGLGVILLNLAFYGYWLFRHRVRS